MDVENIGPSWGLRACLWEMQKTPLTRFPRFLGVFILFSWMREKLKSGLAIDGVCLSVRVNGEPGTGSLYIYNFIHFH